jgi:hypothetical protein
MDKRLKLLIPISIIFLIFLAANLFAQLASQQISGFVKDKSGAVIPGAIVTVKQVSTQMERTATTSDTGYYVIANLPIGIYEVSSEMQGFKKFLQTGVEVTVGSKPTVDLTFEVGGLSAPAKLAVW